MIDVEEELHRRVKMAAVLRGVPMRKLVERLLEEGLR